jgi:hypothetical protein
MARRKGPARCRRRESFWRRIVERQPASGLSIREWCDLRGVSEPSFYAWRRELARRAVETRDPAGATRPQFVPVEVREAALRPASAVNRTAAIVAPAGPALPTAAAAPGALHILLGDVRIEVAAGFDGSTLRELVTVLRSLAAEEAAAC